MTDSHEEAVAKSIENIQKFCNGQIPFKDLDDNIQRSLIIDASYTLFQGECNRDVAFKILYNSGTLHSFANIEGSDFNVYIGSDDLSSLEQFILKGVITGPVYTKKERRQQRDAFDKSMLSFPEYRRNPDNPSQVPNISDKPEDLPVLYTLGGFSALGNPSSFHTPFVRKLRETSAKAVENTILKPYIENHPSHTVREKMLVEVLIDRMMYRRVGSAPQKEAWHRDVANKNVLNVLPDDVILGGWVNLDDTNQYFSYIPGSHLGINVYNLTNGGFSSPFDKLDSKINKLKTNSKLSKRPSKKIEWISCGEPSPEVVLDGDELRLSRKDREVVIKLNGDCKASEISSDDTDDSDKIFIIQPSGKSFVTKSKEQRDLWINQINIVIKEILQKAKREYMDEFSSVSRQIVVPPGHFIAFPQYILHEVVSNKRTTDMRRVFTGYRLTLSKESLLPDLMKDLTEQAPIRLPSGQLPPLYGANVGSFFMNKPFLIYGKDDPVYGGGKSGMSIKMSVSEWSQYMFKDTCYQKDDDDGVKQPVRVPRFMKSLAEMGISMYPKYTREEKDIYIPHKIS